MTPDEGRPSPPAGAGAGRRVPSARGPAKDGARASDDEPVLPRVTRDELDEGWGDARGSGERDADWYRRERPPHHE